MVGLERDHRRLKPKAAHPIRPLFDRLLRAFELTDVELAVSDHAVSPSIACEDEAWVVVPASLSSLDDARALAALARPMTRIALGVPWLDHLGAHDVLALLVAFARLVSPGFAAQPANRVEPLVADHEAKARCAIDRRRRRLLEELEPRLEVDPTTLTESAFAEAVVATEARAAFLVSGSLRAALDALAPVDPRLRLSDALRAAGAPALAAVFAHPWARDLTSFALSPETTALRGASGWPDAPAPMMVERATMTKTRPLVLSYSGCSTCKKALKWFAEHGIEVDVRPIVEAPPSADELGEWIPRSKRPCRKWLNTSGQSYRAMGKAKVDSAKDEEIVRWLTQDGKLVKRPVVVTSRRVLVGFDEEAYAEAFGG